MRSVRTMSMRAVPVRVPVAVAEHAREARPGGVRALPSEVDVQRGEHGPVRARSCVGADAARALGVPDRGRVRAVERGWGRRLVLVVERGCAGEGVLAEVPQ